MRSGIHPEYHRVAFRDRSADLLLVTRSTCSSEETIEIDGETLPLIDVEISSASHPFWTGRGRVIDSEGRVEAFRRRYGAAR